MSRKSKVQRWPQNRLTRQLESLESRLLLSSTLLPVTNHNALIFDALRNQLDIPGGNGLLYRYDLTSNVLSSITVGGNLGDGDITPDGSTLYLTDRDANVVHKINLTTGSVTNLSGPGDNFAGASDLVILSSTQALLATAGPTSFRTLDLTTDTFANVTSGPLVDLPRFTSLYPSVDHKFLFIDAFGDNGDPLFTYDVQQNVILGQASISFGLWRAPTASFSPVGALVATGDRSANTTTIWNPQLQPQITGLPEGTTYFSPTYDTLYLIPNATRTVQVYDTTTFALKATVDLGEVYYQDNGVPGVGTMATSADGKMLFVATNGGVRAINVDESNLVTSSLVVSSNSLFTGGTLTLSATINGSPIPGSSLQFFDGNQLLGSVPTDGTSASFSTSLLSAGVHDLTAAYVNSAINFNAPSAVIPVVVISATSSSIMNLPVLDHTDLIINDARNELEIPASNGDILRYDISNQTFLPAFHLRGTPGRGDVTLDGNILYLTDQSANVLHSINLNTGAVTDIPIDPGNDSTRAIDVAIPSATSALVSSNGSKAIRNLDLTTNTFAPSVSPTLSSIVHLGTLYLSADRTTLLADDFYDDGDPLNIYDIQNDVMLASGNVAYGLWRLGNASISPDGSMVVTSDHGGLNNTKVSNRQFQTIFSNLPSGPALFSSTFNSLYILPNNTNTIEVFDTTNFHLKCTFSIANSYNWDNTMPGTGTLVTAPDGKTLFVATNGGVSAINVDESNLVTSSLAVSSNSLLTGATLTLSATITGSPAPGSSVQFFDGNQLLATVPVDGNSASFSTSLLDDNVHDLTANYVDSASSFNVPSSVRPVVVIAPINGSILNLPVLDRTDLIINAARNELEIPTTNGDILRYDIASQNFLPAYHIRGTPGQGDVTLDGNILYLADQNANLLHSIDLNTGAVTDITLEFGNENARAIDVAVLSSTRAVVSSIGSQTIRNLDLTTNTFTPPVSSTLSSIVPHATLYLSADRKTLLADDFLSEDDPLSIYDIQNDAMLAMGSVSFGLWRLPNASISPDGSKVATTARGGPNGTKISNRHFKTIIPALPGGSTYFSPTYNTLYILLNDTNTVQLYDTSNFHLKRTFSITYDYNWDSTQPLTGTMCTSPDGKTLFIATNGGINLLNVSEGPIPTPTISASSSSSAFSQTTTLTAHLNPGTFSNLDSITFKEGKSVLGVAPINSSGTAQFTLNSLPVGNHNITATYISNHGISGHQSAPTRLKILPVVPTLTISAPAIGLVSNPPQFTIIVNGLFQTTPTGTVDIYENNTLLGSATLANGSALCSLLAPLSQGIHSLTAHYRGDSNYVPANSDPRSVDIEPIATTTTLASNHTSSVPGSHLTFQATVSSAANLPIAGQVAFYNGLTLLGSASVNASGFATLLTGPLGDDDYLITASFGATTDFLSSSSSALFIDVQKSDTTTTLSPSRATDVPGASATLTATVTPSVNTPITGQVAFYSGDTLLGFSPVNLSGNATFVTGPLLTADYQFTASFLQNAGFNPSASLPVAVAIHQTASMISLTPSQNYTNLGTPISFTATVTGDASIHPTGIVTFFEGPTVLGTAPLDANGKASLPVTFNSTGSHLITAAYAGSSSFQSSTSSSFTENVSLYYTIDLLAIYPSSTLFTPDWLLQDVQDEIDNVNQAMTNSQVPVVIRLVGLSAVNYNESGDINLDWERLDNPNDGFMDSVPFLRNQTGADLVVLLDSHGTIDGDSIIEGVGSELYSLNSPLRDQTDSIVIDVQAPHSDYVLAHEIGHTFGLSHALGDPQSIGISADAHGYRFKGNDNQIYHDIMAYDPGQVIPYYSNPNILYAGKPIGNATSANGARVLLQSAPVIAQYRTSLPIGAITSADASVISGWAIDPKDFLNTIDVRIDLDGTPLGTLTAGDYSQGLYLLYSSTNHGFSFTLPHLTSGSHTVRIYGIDSITGQAVLVASRTITADHLEFTHSPATTISGHILGPSVTVAVKDSTGRLDVNYNADITVSLSGNTGATLSGTLVVPVINGIATFSDLSTTTAGTLTLTATDGILNPVKSKAFTILGDPATSHLVLMQNPGDSIVGNPLMPALTVFVEDQFGNVVKSDHSKVTLSIFSGPSGAALKGSPTVTAKNGVAVFTSRSLTKAGNYQLAVSVALNASGPGTSGPLLFAQTILPAASHVTVPNLVKASSKAGSSFSLSVKVTAAATAIPFAGSASVTDSYGNVLGTGIVAASGGTKVLFDNLSGGTFICHVIYSGDANHAPSTSSAFTLINQLA